MKKRIGWLLVFAAFTGMVCGGCRRFSSKQFSIGFIIKESTDVSSSFGVSTTAEIETEAMEVTGTLRDKAYNGVVYGNKGRVGQPTYAIATYEEDGKRYRYTLEPLSWSIIEGDSDAFVLEPSPSIGECRIYAAGGKLGKIKLMATAESGKTDIAVAYIVPDMLNSAHRTPIGLVCDEEMWMTYPDSPGWGAIVPYKDERADVIFTAEAIRFPYGAVSIKGANFGTHLTFGEVDWDTPIDTDIVLEQGYVEYPYNGSQSFLMLDKNGRKIVIHMRNSQKEPLKYIAWHAQDREYQE